MERKSFETFAAQAREAQEEARKKSAKKKPQPERLPPGQVVRIDPELGRVKRLIRDNKGRLVPNPLFEANTSLARIKGTLRPVKLDPMGKPIKPPTATFDPRFAHLRQQAKQQSQEPTPEPTPQKPKQYIQKWIPDFPPPKELKVKPSPKVKLPPGRKQPKSPKPKTRQLTLKLKEFYLSFKQSLS
jgi:hypothetical protein